VLASKEHRVKVSMRSPLLLPRLAIVDPQLTLSVPPAVTASTGLDALTQVLEPYLSDRANPLVDGLCRDGLMRAGRALQQAFQNGENLTAREDMSLVSLYGGLALANAGLGAVHGFAGPFGGMFDASHGTICAAFLPATMKVNWEALQDRGGDHPSLGRFEDAARWLTGNPDASAEDLIAWLEELNRDLAIPRLRELGLTEDQFPALIEKAARSSSMKANPVQLTDAEMARILQLAL
jgi:alcohol dehydrogenase class IV